MKKKVLWIGLILIGIVGFVYWGNGQNKGKVVVNQRFWPVPTELKDEQVYNDDFLSWKYSYQYEPRKIETTDGRVLTNIELLGREGLAVHYTITLRQASQELADFSAVQFRRSRPDEYTEEIAEWGEDRGLLFKTADNKEKTVFFRRKDRILSVSMTANSNDSKLDEEFKKFWQGIEWKNW